MRRTLRAAFEKADYDVLWCSYFNTFLFPLVAVLIISKRIFRPLDMYRSDIHPLPDWLNGLLYKIFRSERLILRILTFPFGASILIVARARS